MDQESGVQSVLISLIYNETFLGFGLGCAVTSVAILFVDFAYFVAQGQRRSLLDITYRGNNFLLILVSWFVGALVVGYIATLISIFETSKQSMVALGILWPVALTRIIAGARAHLGAEETENLAEEDEE